MTRWDAEREILVAEQVEGAGVRDRRVLAALRSVRRELFVPEDQRNKAYHNRPLPIGFGQTISQPLIVAIMIEAMQLEGGEKVLEIGAGSGYAAAVLAEIAAEVFTIERISELAKVASTNLASAGYENVEVRCADGTEGWPEEAPFDAILVSAGAPEAPAPLKRQLKVGGRLVIPVGSREGAQELIRVTRVSEDRYKADEITEVRFVPLIGKEAWD